jgi:hypothetical protein
MISINQKTTIAELGAIVCEAFFYHWNDRQGLDQAVWVCEAQPVDLADVKKWSKNEGKAAEFEIFLTALTKKQK